MKKAIKVSSDHIRALKSPHDHTVKTYYAYVHLNEIPVDFPLSPNPRVPKPNDVIRRVRESLKSDSEVFHILNRGITISAKSAEYSNSDELLTLDIPDGEDEYGILDGGHSYYAVQEIKAKYEELPNQYVKLEVLTGVEEILPDIASARNFSKAVKAISLATYRKELDWLKNAMGDVSTKVKWSENDALPFDVLDYIQALFAFDIKRFSAASHPLESYKNAGKCLDAAANGELTYLSPVTPDIIKLYDTIRFTWWNMYKSPDETGRNGRPGRLKEVQERQRGRGKLLQFPSLGGVNPDDALYHVEKGLVMPVLASFRVLVQSDEQKGIVWRTCPFNFWETNGPMLVRKLMEASDQRGSNPHVVGRDKTVYEAIYESVELAYLKANSDLN